MFETIRKEGDTYLIEITGYTAEEIVDFVNNLRCPNDSSIPEVNCESYKCCYDCLVKHYNFKAKII